MAYGKITRLPSKEHRDYQLRITDSPGTIYLSWSDLGSYQEKFKPGALALGAVWEVAFLSGDRSARWEGLRLCPADWKIFEGEGWRKIDGRRSSGFFIGSQAWAEKQFAEQFPETLFNDRKIEEAF